MESLSNALPAIGSFHPLVLHLPIGLLAGIVALELWLIARPATALRPTIGFLLLLTSAGALISAATGLSLATGGSYDEGLLWRHRTLGLITAACVSAAAGLHHLQQRSGSPPALLAYRITLTAGVLATVGAGHYGSIITHGDNTPIAALTTLLRNGAESNAVALPVSTAAELAGQPILAQHCYECHGPEKQKNELRLDVRAAALKGGKSGKPAIVPGNAMASLLVEAITLPAENKRAMPPSGKRRLEAREVLALIDWINRGASWPDAYQRHPDGVAQPDASVIADLRRQGVQVSQLSTGHPLVRIEKIPPGVRLAALRPIAAHVAWLDLSGFAFAPGEPPLLAELPHLSRLELQRSNVRDADLVHLAALRELAFLNLYATDIGDEGSAHLTGLQSLAHLYIFETRISPAALDRLRAALPQAAIETATAQDALGPPPSPTAGS